MGIEKPDAWFVPFIINPNSIMGIKVTGGNSNNPNAPNVLIRPAPLLEVHEEILSIKIASIF
jgi:hypothetical protein